RLGDYAHAIDSGVRALRIATPLEDIALRTTDVIVGLTYYALGDFRRAIESLRGTISALQGRGVGERFGWAGVPAVTSRAYLVGCLAELGEFAEGIALGNEAIRIAPAANHPFSLGQACINLGILYLRKGDSQLATAVLERATAVSGLSKVSALSASIAATLGYAHALSGRLADAIPLLEHGVEQSAAKRIT